MDDRLREIEERLSRIKKSPWTLKNDLDGDAEAFLTKDGPWIFQQLRETRALLADPDLLDAIEIASNRLYEDADDDTYERLAARIRAALGGQQDGR